MRPAGRGRVRARWTPPPGPLPAGPADDPTLLPGPGETLDHLSGEWRIFQHRRGHRWSTDDLLTAWFACRLAADVGLAPARHLDLGAGIGSVALLVAWRFPEIRTVAVEAQAASAALFARSIRYNGASARIDLRHGDLRDAALLSEGATFDLVTGSPPYLSEGEAVVSAVPQRAACRFELRGGLEGYLDAMARALAPHGVGALVHHDAAGERLAQAAAARGLAVVRRRTVVFKEGRAPLVAVYGVRRAGEGVEAGAPGSEDAAGPPLVIRRADSTRSPEWSAAREFMGYPP